MFGTEHTETRITDLFPESVPGRIAVAAVALLVFFVAVGLQFGPNFAVGFAIGIVAVLTGDTGMIETFVRYSWILIIVSYVLWIAIGAVATRFFEIPATVEVPDGKQVAWAGGSLVLVLALALVANYGLTFLGEEQLLQQVEPGQPALLLAGSAVALLLAAPAEELLFRATIQGSLRDEFSAPAAIVGANLFFVPLHVFNTIPRGLVVTAVNLVLIFSLGMVLGALYDRHRNLLLPTAVHFVYNGIVIGVAIFG